MSTAATERGELAIDQVRFQDEVYPRIQVDAARVADLAELLAADQVLPPVIVERESRVILGGRHTLEAYESRGATMVPVVLVDVPPADRLLFAYRQDVTAALPYRDADVRKVARLEYARRRSTDSDHCTADAIATALGRSRRSVQRWIADLVERDEEDQARQRQARVLAGQAFAATGTSQRRIAIYLGGSQKQVSRDGQVAATTHHLFSDSQIVGAAESLIHLSLGLGATRDEVKAAIDWLLERTNPEAVAIARSDKYFSQLESDLTSAIRFLSDANHREPPRDLFPDTVLTWELRITTLSDQAAALVTSIRRKVFPYE